jgi:hypothetical protein
MQQEHGKNGDKKCKYLNFNLYGSPSGPRCRNVALRITYALHKNKNSLKMGFDQSTTDPSLFAVQTRGATRMCIRRRLPMHFPPNDKSAADHKEFVEDIRDSFALRGDDDGMTDTNEFCGMCIGIGDVLSASLLHLRSRLPPCSAVLLRVPSAGAQCARARPRVGVPPVRLPVGLPLPPARVPTTGPELPCVYRRGLTQVCSVPPLRLHAAMAPHLSSETEAPLS